MGFGFVEPVLVSGYTWSNVLILACGSICVSSFWEHGFNLILGRSNSLCCGFRVMIRLSFRCGVYQVFTPTISSWFSLLYAFLKWCKPSLDDCGNCVSFVLMVVLFETCYTTDCPTWCEPSSDDVGIVMLSLWSHNIDYGWLVHGLGNFFSDSFEYSDDLGFGSSWFRVYFVYSWYFWRDMGSLVMVSFKAGVCYEERLLLKGCLLMCSGHLSIAYRVVTVFGSSTSYSLLGFWTHLLSMVNLVFFYSENGIGLLEFTPGRVVILVEFCFGLMVSLGCGTLSMNQRYVSLVVKPISSPKSYWFYYLEDLKANILILVGVLNNSCALFSLPGVCPDGFYSGRFLRRQYYLVKCSMSYSYDLNLVLKLKISVINLDPALQSKNIAIFDVISCFCISLLVCNKTSCSSSVSLLSMFPKHVLGMSWYRNFYGLVHS